MDKTPTVLDQLVTHAFVPHVLLVTTKGVDEACLKNGPHCRLINLLQPLCHFENAHLIRGIRDEPYELKGFRIRLMEPADFQLSADIAAQSEADLNLVVSSTVDPLRYAGQIVRHKKDVPAFRAANKTRGDITPWFRKYQLHLLRSLGVSDHEFFNHPVACIFVVESTHEDPREAAIKMQESLLARPGLFKEGFMDQSFARFFVLLHDGHNDRRAADAKISAMRTTFGPQACQLLAINSLPPDQPHVAREGQATFLTPEDHIRLHALVTDVAFKVVVPHIERVAQTRNENLSATRKTFKSQFFRFIRPFGGGSRPTTPTTDSNIKYPLQTSASAQSRQLGDFLFFLRDFENAAYNYKLCAQDYRTEKALKHAGGSMEMIAICQYFLVRNTQSQTAFREAEGELERAIEQYQKANEPRFAARAAILLALMRQSRRALLDAASVYIQMAENELCNPLLGGLLLEQAALCCLYVNPPQFRKFNMHLVFAGDRFRAAGQLEHSLGCYKAAHAAYHGRRWMLLDDHTSAAIARSSYYLNDIDRATEYAANLLAEGSPAPANVQSSYLREFVHILQKAAEKSQVMPELPFPMLEAEQMKTYQEGGGVRVILKVQYAKQSEGSGRAFVGTEDQDDKDWRQMETSLVYESVIDDSYENLKCFYPPSFHPLRHAFKRNVSVVGEEIIVETKLHNPLRVPIQLNAIQLVCDHYGIEEDNEVLSQGSPPPASAESAYRVEPFDLLLGPKDSHLVQLRVTPLREGLLEIRSVGFQLGGVVWGRRDFRLQNRRLNRTKEQRQANASEPNLSLSLQITSEMPLLEVESFELPSHLLEGEVRRLTVGFSNRGPVALKNVRVKVSHPGFFEFGQVAMASADEARDIPFPRFEAGERTEPLRYSAFPSLGMTAAQESHRVAADCSIIHLPIDELAPYSTQYVHVWVRGHAVGSFSFRLLYYYEPAESAAATSGGGGGGHEIKYRVLRANASVLVLPSLSAAVFARTSVSGLDSYLLGITVENVQNTAAFQLAQVTSISRIWALEPVAPAAAASAATSNLGPREATTIFLRARLLQDPSAVPLEEPDRQLVHAGISLTAKGEIDTREQPYYTLLTRARHPEGRAIPTAHEHFLRNPARLRQDLNTMDLMLLWHTTTGNVFGQSFIHNIHILPRPQAPPPPPSRSLAPTPPAVSQAPTPIPLRFLVNSATNIVHDFDTNRFCLVPVTFSIANTSIDSSFTVRFETIKPDDHKQVAPMLAASQWQYMWSGTTQQNVGALEAQQGSEITANVCFFQPGVYDINRFKFVVNAGTPQEQHIYSPFQHFIRVASA